MAAPEERKTKYNRPLVKEEFERIMKTGMVLLASSLVFCLVFGYMVHQNIIRLYPKSMSNADALKGFASRVEYTLRYQTLLVFWLLFNVLITIYGRISKKAINPLDESKEHHVQIIKNILTNSYESIVISLFSQLIFVSFAEPIIILKFIPMVNVIQLIGRIAFFAGYPFYRAFGYQATMLPNMVLNVYNLYRLGSFVELY